MGLWAVFLAAFCFLGPMALPLALPGWRSLLGAIVLAALFFGWMTAAIDTPGSLAQGIGGFLGGLMLFGFASGTIARMVALIGRRPEASDL